jgi:hypothetical protein
MTQEVIINDIDGNPIHEGDRVWGFAQNYESRLVDDSGGIPVYEEFHDKPKPVSDVPLFNGAVYWSEDMLAWWIKLDWVTPAWETQPCAIAMGGGSYAYQKQP